MLTIILGFLGSLFKSGFGRAMDTVDKRFESEAAKEQARNQVLAAYLDMQKAVLTGPGWWFPILFIAPLGVWFAAVCLYSILWCAGCAYPQAWSIAALPAPLDDWAGVIVASLFGAASLEKIMARWKK